MKDQPVIKVIIPAFNEEPSVHKVIEEIPDKVLEIIVVNNGSTDDTSQVARKAGATVIETSTKGYGHACLLGIDHAINQTPSADILVFMDADYSDFPGQLHEVIEPILTGKAEFVVGSRALGNREGGSMTPQQILGNKLAVFLIKLFYGVTFTDLGPFRAISRDALKKLEMKDTNYGWTVEMQVKAARKKVKSMEVPVDYKMRIGQSKVSGTIKGTVLAGYKILLTIFKYIW